MILAKVKSRVVSSASLASLPKRALLEVSPLLGFGDPASSLIVIDAVQAGPGDTVLVLQEGTGVREICGDGPTHALPSQMAAVGIVDRIDFEIEV
jgi:microcompartment protein CcmK/EutM